MKYLLLLSGFLAVSLSAEMISDRFSASLDYKKRNLSEEGYFLAETSSGYLVAGTTQSDRTALVQASPLWLSTLTRDDKGVWQADDGFIYLDGENNKPLYFGASQDPNLPKASYIGLVSSSDSSGLNPNQWPRLWTILVDEKGKEIQRQAFGSMEKFGWKSFRVEGATQLRDGAVVVYGQVQREGMKCAEGAIILLTPKRISPVFVTDAVTCNAPPTAPQGIASETVKGIGQNSQGDLWVLVSLSESFRSTNYSTGRLERRTANGDKLVSSVKLSVLLPPDPPKPVETSTYQSYPQRQFEYFLNSLAATEIAVDENRVVLSGTHTRWAVWSHAKSIIKANEEARHYSTLSSSSEKNWVAEIQIKDGAVSWVKRFGGCGDYGSGDADLSAITLAAKGDILLAGSCTPQNKVDPLLLTRLSREGNLLWSRQFYHRGDRQLASSARAVIEDRTGDLVAIGTVRTARSGGDTNVFVVKTNPDGVIE